ncbi:quinon protein alcohol dehydrogenase-like superfamily [Hygrophoropsis aurantiaca]|uniref:Quinon protein alcohol dehydrogenase-like superfamily n=1 Tax=Hygrophoropsis aurantiaca TaxID=72124 RepID=A0ACB7ZWB9_9AGAM|nr:quinon protein alcohol dehydrogenase-like superfamily [Hygrophoropsis aurantiaca]
MSTSASSEVEAPEPKDPDARFPTKVFEGHTSHVKSIAYFHDGKRIISGSFDKTVRIWDVESQQQVGKSLMHDFDVHSMALSPDERRLVSGGEGVVLWDLEGRTVLWKREASEVYGYRVAYSPDGRLIAANQYGGTIELLNAETGEQIRYPLRVGETVYCLAFSPDGGRLAAGSDKGNVQVFDVATGETVVGPIVAHTHTVRSLIYTFDGQQIITASGDFSIRVWDAATGQNISGSMLGHKSDIWQIPLSPDGQRLASVSFDSTVRVWDLKTRRQIGGPLRTQESHRCYSVAWSPNGRSIVSGFEGGKIHLWDAPPLDDHTAIPQAPAPTASSPPAPSTSQSRANSISSSILNMRAGSSPTPPQSLRADTGPDEDNNWEYSTNESFDSVLDAPADVTQPAQRRKRRHRRRAPVASTPSPAIPVLPNVPPSIVHPSAPPQNQTSASPVIDHPTPEGHGAADSPTSRVSALRRLWRQRPTLSRWTRRKTSKNRNEPHENQPVHPSPAPNNGPQSPSAVATSVHSAMAVGDAEATTPKPNVISRLFTRSKRPTIDTTPEHIEMRPPQTPPHRNPAPHTRRQSAVVNVAAGRLDRRMAASSNKWTDKIDWLDYICFCMCCPWNKVISESDSGRGPGDRPGAGDSSGSSASSSSDRVSYDPDEIY